MTTQLAHPTLGTIIGNDGPSVASYLGIRYATLANRFANAQLPSYPPNNHINATDYGPSAVSALNACGKEHVFIQQPLPHGPFSFSETDCLNLNVFVPKTSQKSLPVFVYVHGGGFAIGSNSWPQYNLRTFVERSVSLRTPVIAININYRLGVFGFLTSQELRDAGYASNNGLRDQLLAFRWVQTHIAGFGGDPNNVTVAGSSAGGVAVLHHAASSESLFKRVASMGGTPLLMKPLSPASADSIYRTVVDKLNITTSSHEERIEKLLTISPDEILRLVPASLPLVPMIDGDIVKDAVTFARCSNSSSILFYMLHDRLPTLVSAFNNSVQRSLDDRPLLATKLLELYGIGQAESSENLQKILEFAHDVGFYAAVISIAEAWPAQVYMYHLNEINPWKGRWENTSTHILDVALLFLNYRQVLPEQQQVTGDQFCEDLLKFVSGREPFPAFQSGRGGAKIYGPGPDRTRFVSGTKSEDYGRRSQIFELSSEVGLDVLSTVWDNFMAGH